MILRADIKTLEEYIKNVLNNKIKGFDFSENYEDCDEDCIPFNKPFKANGTSCFGVTKKDLFDGDYLVVGYYGGGEIHTYDINFMTACEIAEAIFYKFADEIYIELDDYLTCWGK